VEKTTRNFSLHTKRFCNIGPCIKKTGNGGDCGGGGELEWHFVRSKVAKVVSIKIDPHRKKTPIQNVARRRNKIRWKKTRKSESSATRTTTTTTKLIPSSTRSHSGDRTRSSRGEGKNDQNKTTSGPRPQGHFLFRRRGGGRAEGPAGPWKQNSVPELAKPALRWDI
jgi:hypothetical protein